MLSDIPTGAMVGALIFSILFYAFFSLAENGILGIGRPRLRQLERQGHRGAVRIAHLLARPERLVTMLLIGRIVASSTATTSATMLASGVTTSPIADAVIAVLTTVLLLTFFGETLPRGLAARNPETVTLPAGLPLQFLLLILQPLVLVLIWLNGVLSRRATGGLQASQVSEGRALLSQRHQEMLIGLLDLDVVTVEDIMVPRSEIAGIDLEAPWDTVVQQIAVSQHTRLPVYQGEIDKVVGIVHLRNLLAPLRRNELSRERLLAVMDVPYFVPEATPLNAQLLHFQQERKRMGLVVNEYGDIQGLVTLDDILEEIVGEFTTDPGMRLHAIFPQPDGTYLVDGSTAIRELNRVMQWQLPATGAKTLNGLITEYLESIPEPGTSILLGGYPIEIVQVTATGVKTARIDPQFAKAGTRAARHSD